MQVRTLTTTLVGIAAAALVLSACGQSETRDESGEIVTGGDTDVFTIQVGDCVAEAADGEVSSVKTVPCTESHSAEVYGEYTFPAGDFPGDDVIASTADEECYNMFADFVGLDYESSALEISYYFPTQDSWEGADDRLVSCLIIDPSQDVTGSLAGAAY